MVCPFKGPNHFFKFILNYFFGTIVLWSKRKISVPLTNIYIFKSLPHFAARAAKFADF